MDHVLDYKTPDKERGPSWWEQKQKAERKKLKKEKKKKEKKKEKKDRKRGERDPNLGGGLLVKDDSSKKKLIQMNDGSVFIKHEEGE